MPPDPHVHKLVHPRGDWDTFRRYYGVVIVICPEGWSVFKRGGNMRVAVRFGRRHTARKKNYDPYETTCPPTSDEM